MREKPDNSALAAVASSGDLSEEEILAAARVIIFGGLETMAATLSNTVWALLSHPVQFEGVLSHPDLLSQAIEEALRWEPLVQLCTRFITCHANVRGIAFAPGEIVQCMVGAANRGPRAFHASQGVRPVAYERQGPPLVRHGQTLLPGESACPD